MHFHQHFNPPLALGSTVYQSWLCYPVRARVLNKVERSLKISFWGEFSLEFGTSLLGFNHLSIRALMKSGNDVRHLTFQCYVRQGWGTWCFSAQENCRAGTNCGLFPTVKQDSRWQIKWSPMHMMFLFCYVVLLQTVDSHHFSHAAIFNPVRLLFSPPPLCPCLFAQH